MALPFFYNEEINTGLSQLVLNEETSKHVVQVLRMKVGERLQITDGKGNLFTTEIMDDHKKKAAVKILSSTFVKPSEKKISIAISLVKNASRFEWFLEKATEIGVNEIIPLLCTRTEKQHFRFERMNGILVSAMLQSQQAWLPVLHEPVRFDDLMMRQFDDCKKYIAHCLPTGNKESLQNNNPPSPHQLILIGPEGDFTIHEIEQAVQNDFAPVALGGTRLRTETAGIVAATLLRVV
ncbi:MAG: 16S rRNA (uracil(1498)-N(3))-methyltransferase [Ferruginibacter sp.]|nr:16S rRNA (uracil(1498)-N(3))-methyltransferase [Ferruginibacter sp.]